MSLDHENCPLIGTWQLEAWFNERPDGSRLYPLGQDASGYISYGSDGIMMVNLNAADRGRYAVSDPFGGTADEDSAAIKSQIAYGGPYDYRGADVIHNVAVASCPNWVGTQQVRRITLDGDRLELSAEGATIQGETVTARVLWRRIAATT